jgi:hypothetical protein
MGVFRFGGRTTLSLRLARTATRRSPRMAIRRHYVFHPSVADLPAVVDGGTIVAST